MSQPQHLSHGLWVPASAIATDLDRCAALLRLLPAGTVLGGLAAAAAHQLWLPDGANIFAPPEVVISRSGTRPQALAASRRDEVRARRRRIRPDETCIVDGIPATTLERTWVDLAEELALPDLIAAGDSTLRTGASTASLAEAIRRATGRRGVVRARWVHPLLDVRSRSRPESHLRAALVCVGMPKPDVNVHITNAHGEWLAEPDLVYRRARLALEYNGADHGTPRRMRRDLTRTLGFDGSGWKVVTFGPAEVLGRPYRVASHVAMLLDERDPGWRERDDLVPLPPSGAV